MTIALGLLASGGAVIAADREEGDGVLKSDEGKIKGVFVAGRGCLAITGAGNGPYLDSVTASLVEWFRSDAAKFKTGEIGEELRRRNHEFYKRSVLPFLPYEESVDYELLICFDPAPTRGDIALAAQLRGIPGVAASLWRSHRLSMLQMDPFAAVGCGKTVAKAMLSKYWISGMPLEIAVNLAAYVAYHVKRTVKDVGLDTDILVLQKNSIPRHIPSNEISEMEAKFAEYEHTERENLYHCLGGDVEEHERFFDQEGEHKRREETLHKFFENLNTLRSLKWEPPKLTPSVPQKPEPEK
jgi:hypothetical protein